MYDCCVSKHPVLVYCRKAKLLSQKATAEHMQPMGMEDCGMCRGSDKQACSIEEVAHSQCLQLLTVLNIAALIKESGNTVIGRYGVLLMFALVCCGKLAHS